MPIKTVQSRLTQVGVIRLGEQRTSQRGKKYPAKLETLRFTSPSKPLIDAVAALYGGEVKPWQANTGPQFEVVTDAKEVPVLVPPQRIDPNLELWGNGFRSRMCDGETEQLRKQPCLCAAAAAAGQRSDPRETCKPTTRMALMLADVPTLGTFKMESHGWNAAAELPTLAAAIENAPQPIPARLVVELREKKVFDPSKPPKEQVETRTFMVPVVLFDFVTPAQAFGGQIGAAARTALGGGGQRQAIEAAKVEPARRKFTPAEYVGMAALAANVDQVRALWTDAGHDEALTDAVKAALQERAAELKPQPTAPAPQPEPATPPAVVPPPTDVVDAEVEPNADQVWMQIQVVAGGKGWNSTDLEERVLAFLKKPWDEANGFDLHRFLTAIEQGEGAGGMTRASSFDLDTCLWLYRYLNQGETWVPRQPRRPLPVADMDPAWRYNAANFLLRRAEHLAHMYRFGMVQSASTPNLREVIGEDHGAPLYSGAVFSDLELMGEHARDAFDAEQDEITAQPESWLKGTALYRALVAELPSGAERERLAEQAKHWSTCPVRSGGVECRCEQIRLEFEAQYDTTPEWTLS